MADTGNAFITIHIFSFGSSERQQLLAGQVGSNLSETGSEVRRMEEILSHLPNN